MSRINDNLGAGVNALMQEYQTITHNLANVSTTGYKNRSSSFAAALDKQTKARPGKNDALTVTTVPNFTQGTIQKTDRKLDMAINGKGFFVIETPEGPRYTRSGVFHLNQQGQLVDTFGNIVSGQGGAINIPQNISVSQIFIASDGTISGDGNNIGKLNIVQFGDDISKLLAARGNSFAAPPTVKPQAATEMEVKQGFTEASNVAVVEELVKLITVTRLYEANMKIIAKKGENSKNILSVAMS